MESANKAHVDPLAVKIEKASIVDLELVRTFGRTAFRDAFQAQNTEENMSTYLEEAFASDNVAKQLNNPQSQFFLAKIDGTLVGYSKINFGDAQTEPMGNDAMEIERIYVSSAYYGRSVGKLLMEDALSLAKKSKSKFVWLGVWEHNPRAQAFYRKYGFVAIDSHVYQIGDDPQTDLIMRLDLESLVLS